MVCNPSYSKLFNCAIVVSKNRSVTTGVAVARGQLEAKLDRSLQRCYRSPRNRRLANHLLREHDALFTFLN